MLHKSFHMLNISLTCYTIGSSHNHKMSSDKDVRWCDQWDDQWFVNESLMRSLTKSSDEVDEW